MADLEILPPPLPPTSRVCSPQFFPSKMSVFALRGGLAGLARQTSPWAPPVPYHEGPGGLDAREPPLHDLEHELAGLAEHHGLPAGGGAHGGHHGARACGGGWGGAGWAGGQRLVVAHLALSGQFPSLETAHPC